MFCDKCGFQLPDDARFCRKCGRSLGADASPNHSAKPSASGSLPPPAYTNDQQQNNAAVAPVSLQPVSQPAAQQQAVAQPAPQVVVVPVATSPDAGYIDKGTPSPEDTKAATQWMLDYKYSWIMKEAKASFAIMPFFAVLQIVAGVTARFACEDVGFLEEWDPDEIAECSGWLQMAYVGAPLWFVGLVILAYIYFKKAWKVWTVWGMIYILVMFFANFIPSISGLFDGYAPAAAALVVLIFIYFIAHCVVVASTGKQYQLQPLGAKSWTVSRTQFWTETYGNWQYHYSQRTPNWATLVLGPDGMFSLKQHGIDI